MAYIKGISYYLPEKVVTNEELLQEFPSTRFVCLIMFLTQFSMTGIRNPEESRSN